MSGFDKARRRAARKAEKRNPKSHASSRPVRPLFDDLPGVPILNGPPGLEKMSDVLEKLVEPWWDDSASHAALQNLLQLGMVAWNLSLIPEPKRSEVVQTTNASFPRALVDSWSEMLKQLIQRKLELFPKVQRKILDFELLKLKSGELHINVKSTIE